MTHVKLTALIHSRLTSCQNRLLTNPSSALAKLEKKSHKEWLALAEAEEKFLFQRSRVNWVESGDCNTAFFHRMVSSRRATNQIHFLEDLSGQRIDNSLDVEAHCVEYYEDLLGGESAVLSELDKALSRTCTPFRCDEASKAALQAGITDAEIKREAFALPPNKSLGPDGFTGEFFRGCWDVIGRDLTNAVKEFFSSGQILKQWNATAITLIPKKEGAVKVGDFRPISCCNAIYKIVSKILANRLQLLLPGMISNSQSAFVKGRLLVENVLLASEMVQGFNRGNISPRGLLKVDLRKAFDSVNWEFILSVLEASDFPHSFSNWIRQCLTTTSFSIKVNGALCGYFKGNRGLRQGDPLSPPLFVMAMEVFGNLLISKFDEGRIGYHPLGRQPKITHLAFADDVMLFFDGKASSLQEINNILDRFQSLSGLSMNTDKTSLFHAGLNQVEADSLATFGFQPGSFPLRYLGLPLLHRKLRKADYSPLTDMVSARFNGWAIKCLSFAGRLQLISSVIYGLINFWMSEFALPKGCIKDLEKLCNSFLWAGNLTKRTAAKVSWSQVCLPKTEGGLGLRSLIVWNKVLNLRLIWLLFSNSGSLWVAWMKEHYIKRTDFWSADAQSNASWIWKYIISLRPMAKALIRCNIGDGSTASFWYDKWSPFGPLIDFIGVAGPRLLGFHLQARVNEASNLQGWKLPSSRARNQSVIALRDFMSITPCPSASRGPDYYSWGVEGHFHDYFSTKITWNHSRPFGETKDWAPVVWFKNAVPKHAFTFWTANLNRLPVRARLQGWGMQISSACCLCIAGEETRDHLLLHCAFSETLWHKILLRLGQYPCIFLDWSLGS